MQIELMVPGVERITHCTGCSAILLRDEHSAGGSLLSPLHLLLPSTFHANWSILRKYMENLYGGTKGNNMLNEKDKGKFHLVHLKFCGL